MFKTALSYYFTLDGLFTAIAVVVTAVLHCWISHWI